MERERDPSYAGLLPSWLQSRRLGHMEVSLELQPGLPREWQDPKHLIHFLLPLQNNKHSNMYMWDANLVSSGLTCCTTRITPVALCMYKEWL